MGVEGTDGVDGLTQYGAGGPKHFPSMSSNSVPNSRRRLRGDVLKVLERYDPDRRQSQR